ncbi:UDP-N-acetylmuramate:L-alanyl-gamma-D-glutamyl-meso-diaminopimelate ligase [Achromatium sp. WMS2]|nr:UDP-N-acetylmuramate:L-alanyl-gamma-D-glutamyl-meso-diaminopimelate ligase [Achromatium sp. WMS2]
MHLHILGICGTFMGGIAQLATAQGHRVTGSDANIYPPMSNQLADAGIKIYPGYVPEHLQPVPDQIIVGNAMTRGNPCIEYMLDNNLPYTSGPQWLAENVLNQRWVLAIAGTHGKTTTTSMLAWILEYAGLKPGFLIGGVPTNFNVSARLGQTPFFVVEADEYDTAFFDKRSKFIHYHPKTLVLNNLEMDHADIFDNLAQIQKQFHHLVRTIPASGRILYPLTDPALNAVLDMGCWTPKETLDIHNDANATWQIQDANTDGSSFSIAHKSQLIGQIQWSLTGNHNMANALAAIAAAAHAGVQPKTAIDALNNFGGVKRRMELTGEVSGIKIYDDFAHHPTAIATTLAGLRAQVTNARIFAILEPRSNTMRLGTHSGQLAASLQHADYIHVYTPPSLSWDAQTALSSLGSRLSIHTQTDAIIADLVTKVLPGDHIIIMSNGGFEGIQQRLLQALTNSQLQLNH